MISVDIRKRLGDFRLDATFEARDETVVLFGPSGSGKSLTLGSVAGLVDPDDGSISIAGNLVFDAARRVNVPPFRREVGYLVQQVALFPHMTADENIGIGLSRVTRQARASRVNELKELLSLQDLGARRPHELSGGQQQRVALARALARPIRALLLDEPFSALDEVLRADLRAEIVRLRASLGIPVVFVTHDLREAHLLADHVAVFEHGRVLQFAPRDEVFRSPSSRRVAELTGVRNVFRATIASATHLEVAGLRLLVARPTHLSGVVDVGIRAERCLLRRLDPDDQLGENCFVANVVSEMAFGNSHTLRLEPEGVGPVVDLEIASRPYEVLGVASRKRWVVELPAADLHVMALDSGRTLATSPGSQQ